MSDAKPATPQPTAKTPEERSEAVNAFLKKAWFLLLYFLLLMLIASFGTIAET